MFITPEDIYQSTKGGLDIILFYYPEAEKATVNPHHKFKVRPSEKTPSASLKKTDDGTWIVTDFGHDQKPRNAIEVVRLEENMDFKSAIQFISEKWTIEGRKLIPYTVRTQSRTRNIDEKEGPSWIIKEHFSELDLRELFSRKVIEYFTENHKDNWKLELEKVCKRYSVYSLESYTYVKAEKAFETHSEDQFPIYLIDFGGYQKIYQPRQLDKSKRFFYAGLKDPKHMGGYPQAIKAYNDLINESTPQTDVESEPDPVNNKKLDEIIICSGERDSLNVAALGFQVVWMNSETAKISKEQFLSLTKISKNVLILPDIDSTGKRAAHDLGMQFLDIKHIQLPATLNDHLDWRGRPCKDVRDYLNHFSVKSFKDLVKNSVPYRSWDMVPQFDKLGNIKGYSPQINNVQLYHFLFKNGFSRIEDEAEKSGYSFIQVIGNVVKKVTDYQIRDYMHNFLCDRMMETNIRNHFYKSRQLSEASLGNLPVRKIDFKDHDSKSQWMFFKNKTWKVTSDEIQEYRPNEVERYVWENELLPFQVKMKDPIFTVREDNKIFDIDIHDNECLYLKFLQNTSNVHWRKQKDGEQLTAEEISENKLHLINKLYAIGYLLHRYKDSNKAWAVFSMDHKISEENESHGGSGKSIYMKAVRHFMQSITINGRDRHLTENRHLFENVNKHTDYVLIDECSPGFDFNFFFAYITGDWNINAKFQKQFETPFAEAPKIGISSNYTIKHTDPSTERRLLYVVFSDYYHHGPSDEYTEAWSPRDEFGINLFDGFDEKQWNLTCNLFAQCIQLYLKIGKFNPPMTGVQLRQLLAEMGESFKTWADVYFAKESGRLDILVSRQDAYQDMLDSTKIKSFSSQRFKKCLNAWTVYNGYELNPKELHTQPGRIIKKIDNTTAEQLYIRTKHIISDEPKPLSGEPESEDMPF